MNFSEQQIQPKVPWAIKARRYLALRDDESINEAVGEANKLTKGGFWSLTINPLDKEIVIFLESFGQNNLAEIDNLAARLITQLTQNNRQEEALTINLLYFDVEAILGNNYLDYPIEHQQDIRERGLKACQEAIQIAQGLNDKPCQAVYSAFLATAFSDSRQFPEAEHFYKEAIRFYRELAGQEPHLFKQYLAISLNHLGLVQRNLRKLADAENSYSESLQIRRTLTFYEQHIFHQNLAVALNNLGNVQSDLQKLPDAEKSHLEALQIRRDLAIHAPHLYNPDLAQTLNNLGVVQTNLRKLADAEKSLTESFRLYQDLAFHSPDIYNQSLAAALDNLGGVQRDLHKLNDAENSFKHAWEIKRGLDNRDSYFAIHDNALTEFHLGNVQADLQKFSEAEISYLGASAALTFAALHNPRLFNPDLARILNNLGLVQTNLHKFAEAENSLLEALRLYRDLALPEPDIFNQDVARTLNNLGNLRTDEQRFADAEKYYIEASLIFQELSKQEPNLFIQEKAVVLNGLGYLQLKQNKLIEASGNFEAARNLIEDLRTKAITIDDRNRILQENIRIYDNLLACYIKMKDWQKALEIAELGKSRSLSDLLNLKSEDLQPKAPNAETLLVIKDLGEKYSDAIKELQRLESYEKYLSEKLNSFENDIKRIEDDNDNDDDTRQTFLQQITEQKQPLEKEKHNTQEQRFATQSRLKNVLQEINKYDQNFPPKAKAIKPESIFEISRKLNRIIVIFRLLEKSTAVIFVFPSGELHIEEIENLSEREMFYLFRDNWLTPYQKWKHKETDSKNWERAIEQTLEMIYEKLIFRVHQILWGKSDCKEVLFVPNRSLALLPLHAASWKEADGKKHYLLEEFTISYAPSLSVFKRCLENEKQRSNKTLFVTNPNECDTKRHKKSFPCAEMLNYGRYNSHLDFSEAETSFIKGLHQPSNNLQGKDATKYAVNEALREDYGFAHFSCHGFYHQENPFDSGLVMSDEVIKLSEIINSNLQNNWLTTLSACETGMVDFASPTDEHFGLPLGFIFAGSSSVWASLWSVSDWATSELMKTAYENLSREEFLNNKPEALRKAQLSILKHLSHPFFWAGFQHFGV